MPINHDQLFKELLTTFFIEFLELFFPSVLDFLDPESVSFIDKELFTDLGRGEKKIMDIVALAESKGQQPDYSFLVHIENESGSNSDFNERFFRYFCTLFLKHSRPIYPIVVFSYDSPKRLDKSSFVLDFPNKQVLNFEYEIVQLNSLDWRDFLKHKNPVAAALMSKMNVAKGDRPKVKLECLRLLVTLKLNPAKMQLISGFVDTYLNLNQQEESVFQSQLTKMDLQEQEQIMEITTSWEQKGIAKGVTQGQSSLVIQQLNRKFGTLDSSVSDKIKNLNSEQLNSLGLELLSFQTKDELRNWLSKF